MKKVKREDLELMLPAGSRESLVAAAQGGADSVYFGVEQLNMRARSSKNFRMSDLPEIVQYCRDQQMKSYLTLNVILYDRELEQMKELVRAAKDTGVTALIASDIAVLEYARSIGLEVHISTQLNVSNTEAVRFFSRYADVMVLARELQLEQVAKIQKAIETENICGPSGKPVKIEMFAHGALCMAVSGKCYLSLHETNHSANRGACFQTCRKAYQVTEKESGNTLEIDSEYIMSPKDLCTISFLDKMIAAGVRVFKIEGRARSPEYVKTTAHAYHEALTAIATGSYTPELKQKLQEQLKTVFNRGFWDGYYLGQRLGEWSAQYGSAATKRKVYLGKVTNYFSKLKVAELKLETDLLKQGDDLLFIGPTTGVLEYTVSEVRLDTAAIDEAPKGSVCSVPVGQTVRRSDKVYKVVDASEIRIQ